MGEEDSSSEYELEKLVSTARYLSLRTRSNKLFVCWVMHKSQLKLCRREATSYPRIPRYKLGLAAVVSVPNGVRRGRELERETLVQIQRRLKVELHGFCAFSMRVDKLRVFLER